MQFFKDLREVTGTLKELVAEDVRHDEDAKLELTVSAQSFAQETREVVDDKLSFSATLMRAGEVDAAKRLLAEVEAEVRDNEVALIEQVNEVKVARAARRERITRMRLARSLAVAMLGAAVMATSAASMAFASFLDDRASSEAATPSRQARAGDEVARLAKQGTAQRTAGRHEDKVKFRGVTRKLTPQALAAYEQLKAGDVGAVEMERLLSLLPTELAQTMRQVLTTATAAEKTVKETMTDLLPRPSKGKSKAADKDDRWGPGGDDDKEEQPADPEPKEEEPTPEPTPTDGGEEPEEGSEEDPDDSMGIPDLGPN